MNHRHYVPVLRWKRAEQKALGLVPPPERASITPLIEVTPKDYREWSPGRSDISRDAATKHVQTIWEAWGELPAFIDFSLLPERVRVEGENHPLALMASEVAERGMNLIPLVRPGFRDSEVETVARYIGALRSGVAIRLRTTDLEQADLQAGLRDLMSA